MPFPILFIINFTCFFELFYYLHFMLCYLWSSTKNTIHNNKYNKNKENMKLSKQLLKNLKVPLMVLSKHGIHKKIKLNIKMKTIFQKNKNTNNRIQYKKLNYKYFYKIIKKVIIKKSTNFQKCTLIPFLFFAICCC